MVSERDVEHIAELADIGITKDELGEFTPQFNEILEYFDLLDSVEETSPAKQDLTNIFREDTVVPGLSADEALANTLEKEEGFFKAPRVM